MQKVYTWILIGLILTSCKMLSPSHPKIFENLVCQPPCWENITPGVTTKQEALSILAQVKAVDQPVVDLNRSDLQGFEDNIRFSLSGNNQLTGYVEIIDDKVSMISFEGSLDMTLQRAINLFGTPQSILLVQTGHFDQVTLIDPQRGVGLSYKLFGSKNLESSTIESDTKISNVIFFDPDQYNPMLDSSVLSAYTLTGEEIRSNLHPWTGYGSFKEKYWPPVTP